MNAEVSTAPAADRQEYYQRLDKLNLTPLWEVLHSLVTPEPVRTCVPAMWQYDQVRPYITESGSLISAREAERRVLILENPALRGSSAITNSLYGGLQLILPGEVAPCHKHSQSALRFVMEGSGAYTAVDGEKTYMHPGDLILTPAMTWHDHGHDHEGGEMVWFDGLDIPIIQMLNAQFAGVMEAAESQQLSRPEGDALARYGSNLMPVDFKPEEHRKTSPVFTYPYDRTREALEQMRKSEEWDPWHGLKMKYINPMTGDHAMPTIATFVQLLPKGFKTKPYRSTDATVFIAVEGKGKTQVGDQTFEWGPRDIFVVPSWTQTVHEASEDAVLFSYSDRGVQEKLDLWRELREDD